MPLDKRYGVGVSSLSLLFHRGGTHMRPNGRCQLQRLTGLFFYRLSVVSNRFSSTPEKSKPKPRSTDMELCQRGTTELSPCSRARTFSRPRPRWRNYGIPTCCENADQMGKESEALFNSIILVTYV